MKLKKPLSVLMSIALLLSITAPAFAVEPQVQGSPDLHVETETGVSIDVYIRSDEIGEFFEEYHDGVLVATVRCDETSITTLRNRVIVLEIFIIMVIVPDE